MKKYSFFILLLLVSTSLLAQNPNPNNAINQYIEAQMQAEHAPGMATLIVKGGEIVWLQGYGMADVENAVPVTPSTVFLLASISKVFTGAALMRLHENGQLDLDADINNYLPFSVRVPNFENDKITARMLMTHTASIADNQTVMETYYNTGDPTLALPDIIHDYFSTAGSTYDANANFSSFAPGSNYAYSNMGTALAGYLVEVVAGMDFSQYCHAQIFEPLCMEHTAWYYSEFDSAEVARPHQWNGNSYTPLPHYGFADYPNGLLRSNVLDLAHFLIAFLQHGTWHNQQWLTTATVNEMLAPQIPSIEPTQGLNWYTEEVFLNNGGTVNVWGHNGGESGASTDMYIDPTTGIGIAVLTNGEGDNLNVVDELYNYALSLTPSSNENPPCNTLGISETVIEQAVLLYPNPCQGTMQVESSTALIRNITIYNALGQAVQTYLPNKHSAALTLEHPGLYSVHTTLQNSSTSISKVVVY